MRIKTFEAPTLQDALTRARDELGSEAVVLNTRQVKSGRLFGLRSSNKVELTAAVDGAPEMLRQAQHDGVRGGQPEPLGRHSERSEESVPNPQSEIAEIRWELQRLGLVVESLMALRAGNGAATPVSPIGPMSPIGPIPPLLTRLGIDEALMQGALSELQGINDPESLASALAARLQPFACPPSLDEPRVIALVGPTGVGKTTTLAKLAARYSIEQGKSVALLTIDTFRIGAVEQLRTYARIMGLPLEVALSPDDVPAGLAKHRDKDLVLIDTVGRSQRSGDHLNELKTFLDAAEGAETHLVVSGSLARETQTEVVERFAALSPVRLIVTKLDEAPNRAALVNLPLGTGMGISCITAGQNVPQDLEFADAGLFARLVVALRPSDGLRAQDEVAV